MRSSEEELGGGETWWKRRFLPQDHVRYSRWRVAINKAKIHHWLSIVRRIKMWQLLILLVVFGALSVFLLRQNNLGMIDAREQVKQADADNKNIKESLINLQAYVTSHMNASLGDGVFLEKSYIRDYQKQLEAAANANNPNSALYAQVEKECHPLFVQGGHVPYTQCAHDKLSAISPGQDSFAAAAPPSVALYTYNFYSPQWSADPAGVAMLLALVVCTLIVLRIVAYVTMSLLLRVRR